MPPRKTVGTSWAHPLAKTTKTAMAIKMNFDDCIAVLPYLSGSRKPERSSSIKQLFRIICVHFPQSFKKILMINIVIKQIAYAD
jgi:hypothetical protein